MLRKLTELKKRAQGFTIIEVLIVLAIAALILVIVLIAIPQLQRTQRNNARKNDIGRLGTVINEWVSNNNGQRLTATTANRNALITSLGNLNQYSFNSAATAVLDVPDAPSGTDQLNLLGILSPNPAVNVTIFAPGNGTNNENLGSVQVISAARCGTNGDAVADTNTRKIVIQYRLEAGGNSTTPVCQEVQ